MEKKQKNVKLISLCSILILLLAVIIGFSYAYFQNILVNDNPTETKIKSPVLDLDITGLSNDYIELSNASLINPEDTQTKASEYSFEISHTKFSNVDAAIYYLNLTDIQISDNLKSSYFKWSLEQNNTKDIDNQNIITGDFSQIEDNYLKLNKKAFVLPNENTDTYTLKIWLENDPNVNQNDLLNGNFSAKLTLEGYVKVD